MRLTELKEKVRMVRMPSHIYDDLIAHEVDTMDSDSAEEKTIFVDAMNRGARAGNIVKVPLTFVGKLYCIYALNNLIDVARDNLDRRKITALTKFHNKMVVSTIGDMTDDEIAKKAQEELDED